MRKKKIFIMCISVFIVLIGVILFKNLLDRQDDNIILVDREQGGILLNTEEYSEGMLSTGVTYKFFGNIDFNEFQRENNFYLERIETSTIIAETYLEAAELGHFLILPLLGSTSTPIDGFIIHVYYCPKTDNWVLQGEFGEKMSYRVRGEPNIFTINRATGSVVEFSRNAGSFYMDNPEELGWKRAW